MPSLTIPDLDERVWASLRDRATSQGRSEAEEARELLRAALARQEAPPAHETLTGIAQRLFGPERGADLGIPPRDGAQDRPPPDFSGPEWDDPVESMSQPGVAAAGDSRGRLA